MLREQRGAASVYVLVMMLVVIAALSTLQSHLLVSVANHINARFRYTAEERAAAGQEEARGLLLADPNYGFEPGYVASWSYPSASAATRYDVTISQPSAYQRKVVSQGWANGTSYTMTHVYQFQSTFAGGQFNNGGENGNGGALPTPDEARIKNASTTVITLDTTNTCYGVFFIGGNYPASCTLPGTGNTSDTSPFVLNASNNALYIQAASGRNFAVIIDHLVYQGSGLVSLASTGITASFADSPTIRRKVAGGAPVAGSSLSLIALPGVWIPFGVTMDGILYAPQVHGNSSIAITGACICPSVNHLTVKQDQDLMNYGSYQIPGLVTWSVTN